MGKNKKSKYSHKGDKHPKNRLKPSDGGKRAKSSRKRDRSESTSEDLDHGEASRSPQRKLSKTVKVTVQNKSDDTTSDARHVEVSPKNSSEIDSAEDGLKIDESNTEGEGVKTRSQGELTEEDLNRELPITGKKSKKIRDNNVTNNALNDDFRNAANLEQGTGAAVKTVTPSHQTGAEGIQIAVQAGEEDLDDDLNVNLREPITSGSGSSTDSSSDSSSSSSTDSDQRYKKRVRGSRKKWSRRRSRQPSSTSSSSDTDDDSYHSKLLAQNPGLKNYIKKSLSGQKSGRKPQTSTRKKSKRGKNSKNTIYDSPSNATVYTPAVKKLVGPVRASGANSEDIERGIRQIRLLNNVSPAGRQRSDASSSEGREERPALSDREQEIHAAAEKLVLDSERQKASVMKLPDGECEVVRNDLVPLKPYNYFDDANFLTTTCHLEPGVIDKAKNGKYVELDKLLNKRMKDQKAGQELKMHLINKEGQCYWGPVKDEEKVTGIKKWEEAFKVYMMVFAQANPSRGAEIMAYSDVISGAAQTFVWENVANYDFYFRKLMENNPGRSWGRIHSQLWSLMLKDHIPKKHNSFQVAAGSKRDWRDIACWRYNRGKCTRGPEECKFEHRCSGCGSFNHIYLHCRNKGRKIDKTDKKKREKSDKKDKDKDSVVE